MVAAPTEDGTFRRGLRQHGLGPWKRQYHFSGPVSVVVFSCEGKVIMDVHAVLKALHQERELLNQAIVTLEILARGKGKRRGRPPRWLREGRREPSSRLGYRSIARRDA